MGKKTASPSDKCGGLPFDYNSARWYYEFLDRTLLAEIQCKGGVYTWSNQRSDEATILEKLDRALSSLDWNYLFPSAIAIIDVEIASDHSPIILLTSGVMKKIRPDFKFESKWLVEEECSKVVKEEWKSNGNGTCKGSFRIKLRRTTVKLRNWNREKFGKNRDSANDVMNKIKQLQDEQLNAEEKQIKKQDVDWLEDNKDIAKLFQEHFQGVYSKNPSNNLDTTLDFIPNVISNEMNEQLSKEVSREEVKNVVFSMGALKAPGHDGFSGIFYHSFWDLINEDLFLLVESFFKNGTLEPRINRTNIVLIPKNKNPTEVQHYRPISLCNFSLKVITKIMASRLKPLLPSIIPYSQSAFVHGRLIQDNIIVCHEAFHAIKRRKKTNDPVMAIKIDMEKAYDKVDWEVLEKVMMKMGFSDW
ncbi:hypothetical protein V6N13_080397 [Hibiscus sabdariffa]